MSFQARQIKTIRENSYKRHTARLSDDGKTLTWQEENLPFNAVWYHLWGGTLVVIGDYGSAVYRWREGVTFDWLAKTHCDYFVEKCTASAFGERPREFDADKFLEDLDANSGAEDSWPGLRAAWDTWRYDEGHEASEETWKIFAREHDPHPFEELWRIEPGICIPWRIVAHWVGLKMATEQLRAAAQPAGTSA